jgi:hypothetical protein
VLADIVVDSNVLAHALNPDDARFGASTRLLETLDGALLAKLCLDEGFDADEARSRSRILSEYWMNVGFGSVASAVLTRIFADGRIREIPARSARRVDRDFVRGLLVKPLDRSFVHVAAGSSERLLVSHDDEDFTVVVVVRVAQRLAVEVVPATVGSDRLLAP